MPTETATTTKRRLTRDERIGQLLDVAQEVFGQQGYDGASIELIARTAGVSRPVVYEHFGSKEGIYLACLHRARAEFDEALSAATRDVTDLEQQLAAGVQAWAAFIQADPLRWSVLFNGVAISGTVAAEATRLRMATVEGIADMIHAARPAAPRRRVLAFAHALSGAGEQLERWWRLNPDISPQEIAGYLHSFAWHGLSQMTDDESSPTRATRGAS